MADEESVDLDKIEEGAPGGGGKNPLLTILVLLNTVLVGAVGYFQFQSHQEAAQKPDIRDIVKAELKLAEESGDAQTTGEAKKNDGILFELDNFTANLAQGDGPRRFVRMNAVLKFSKDSSEEEFKARKPQIRDAIISMLNSKRPEDLLKKEGKAYLKEEIKSTINTFLVDGKILDVYYVSFQIN